jgi:hypothetical protein
MDAFAGVAIDQGDPLSPLLFMLVMEVLNALIHEADRCGIFNPLPNIIKHRASVYADDLVIFLSPGENDLRNMCRILDLFAGSSGLQTNVDKCVLTPIRCSQAQIDEALMTFPCKVQAFPTTYLGASLSLSRLPRAEEQRFVDKVASRIPTWKGILLTTISRARWCRPRSRPSLYTYPYVAAYLHGPLGRSTDDNEPSYGLARKQSRAGNARLLDLSSVLPRTWAA